MEGAVRELNDRLGGLPAPEEAEDIWGDIWIHEAHHSTATEGNTLVLSQVEQLLREGRAVGDKELREYNEVNGYAKAAQWVYSQALSRERVRAGSGPLLSIQEVRRVHHEAMAPVWLIAPHPHATPNEGPGSFREHNIQPFPRGMVPPDWTDVSAQMRDLVDWVVATGPAAFTLGIAELVATFHARYERIHPFLDGNGRTGRLVVNLLLVRLGHPPVIVDKRDRSHYLRALDRADHDDASPLTEIFARSILASLNRFIIPAVAGPAEFVPLSALTGLDLTARALRNAAERGRLKAYKGDDGVWRSSQKLVDEYAQSRYRRTAQ